MYIYIYIYYNVRRSWITTPCMAVYFLSFSGSEGSKDCALVFMCCSVLQRGTVCCSVVQSDAVQCSVLQCVAVCCSVLQRGAAWCSVVQRGAAWCDVLQCATVCYCMMQCVAELFSMSICLSVCTYTYRWTYIHTYIHTPIHPYTYTCMPSGTDVILQFTTINTRTHNKYTHNTTRSTPYKWPHTASNWQHLQHTYTRSTTTSTMYIHTINDDIRNIHTHDQRQHLQHTYTQSTTTYIQTINDDIYNIHTHDQQACCGVKQQAEDWRHSATHNTQCIFTQHTYAHTIHLSIYTQHT